MRELHVVALIEDGRFAVLATSPDAATGSRGALDDRLVAALRGDPVAAASERSVGAALTLKEIQARLRAGESAAQIAHAAGVDVARVDRFSGPVQSERARVIEH